MATSPTHSRAPIPSSPRPPAADERTSLVANRKTNRQVCLETTEKFYCYRPVLPKNCDEFNQSGLAVQGAVILGATSATIAGGTCLCLIATIECIRCAWCYEDLIKSSTIDSVESFAVLAGCVPAAVGFVITPILTCPCWVYVVSNAILENNLQAAPPPNQIMQ